MLKPQHKFNYLSIENIEANSGELVGFAPTSGEKIKSSKIAFSTDDVLYSKLRPYLNKVHLPSFDGVSATDLVPIRPLGGIPREYVGYFLRTRGVLEYANLRTRGIQLPRISVEDLLRLPVPFAPIPEQKRIIAKLSLSLRSSRIARKSLEKLPSLMKQFRQSVLAKAFRGELRERDPNDEPAEKLLERIRQEHRRKWEEELRAKGQDPREYKYKEPTIPDVTSLPRLPRRWTWVSVGQILRDGKGIKTGPFGTVLKKADRRERGVPLVGIPCIEVNKFARDGIQHVSEEKARTNLAAYKLRAGDVIISRSGTIDRACVVPDGLGLAVMSSNLMRIALDDRCYSPELFSLFLNYSQMFRYQVERESKGSTRIFLNNKILRSIVIPLPPLNEQRWLVDKVEEVFTLTNQTEVAIRAAIQKTETFEQSILTKAFRGELVPQDPNDEPASVLLERIRAQRAAMGKKTARRKLEQFASPAAITPKA